MATIERESIWDLATPQPSINHRLESGPVNGRTIRLNVTDAGIFLLGAAACWGLTPLLVMGLLLSGLAAKFLRDALGMAGPGGEL